MKAESLAQSQEIVKPENYVPDAGQSRSPFSTSELFNTAQSDPDEEKMHCPTCDDLSDESDVDFIPAQ